MFTFKFNELISFEYIYKIGENAYEPADDFRVIINDSIITSFVIGSDGSINYITANDWEEWILEDNTQILVAKLINNDTD